MPFMKAELLEREFGPRCAAPEGGVLLLRAADALDLVDRAAEEGVPIVAIHGFRLAPQGVAPAADHASDHSAAVAEGHGCWAEADAFIRARGDEPLVFALTLGDDPVEAV